ncbi:MULTISPECIES: amino acid ABC transporter permease [Clostridium]|uniref:amino acid ABC transporter permease n=1 Tax=Clostridium TaxID=1485 RepID=UPI000825D7F2|nr:MULTISPECIES: amino acid ABC transporter permease [Clostridium]PJI07603.1 amino acid ABC transporter permease [Clostridium sp. CT7]
MLFDTKFAMDSFPKILAGVPMTLFITIFAIMIGLVVGLVISIVKIKKVPVLSQIAGIYISFVRGTPILVQLYVVFYGIPELLTYINRSGIHVSQKGIPNLAISLIAFTLNASAYLSENIRSALNSVDKGQYEAAYSVGMTELQCLKRIVIPQALVVAVPNFSNVFLEITKDTSLAFTVMVTEIMAKASIQASNGYKYLEVYVDAAIIYFIVCFIFGKLFDFVENRLKKYKTVIA